MKIILDERETALYSSCINQPIKSVIEKRVLDLGDILIVSNNSEEEEIYLIIERKSLSDLVSSIKDGRYEEQSHRLQHASHLPTHNIIYIIEGMFSQLRSPQDKKMVLSAMTSLNYFKGFSVIRTCSVTETAEFIINMTDKIERDVKKGKIPAFSHKKNKKEEFLGEEKNEENEETTEEEEKEEKEEKGEEKEKEGEKEGEKEKEKETKKYCEVVKKVKKENITKENMGEIILCQIPGISSTTAIAIMNFVDHSLEKLLTILTNSPEELQNIKMGKMEEKQRKISKKNIENMIYFLLDTK